MTTRCRPRWSDLRSASRAALVAASAVQLALAVAAWRDLARRPAAAVCGPKPLWAAAICVDFVGPLAYLRWGRRR